MNIYDHLRRLRKMVEPIGREREAEAQRQAALLRDYRTAFGGQAGRRVLLDLIARTGVMQTTHTPGDPLATAFAEGRRRIGLEILQMLADGASNREVAEALVVSVETVKTHVKHILAKLEAEHRTQAVAIGIRQSLIH